MSTKLDPFSYLSVPIPHAHERQIGQSCCSVWALVYTCMSHVYLLLFIPLEIIWSPVCRLPDKRKLVR